MSASDNTTPNPDDRDNAELKDQPIDVPLTSTAGRLAPAEPSASKNHIYPSETFVRLTANQMPFLTNKILVPQDVCDALVEEAIRQRAGYPGRAGGQTGAKGAETGTEKGGEPIRKPLFRQGEEEVSAEESGDDPDPSPDHPHVSVEGNRATHPRRKRRHFKPGTETVRPSKRRRNALKPNKGRSGCWCAPPASMSRVGPGRMSGCRTTVVSQA